MPMQENNLDIRVLFALHLIYLECSTLGPFTASFTARRASVGHQRTISSSLRAFPERSDLFMLTPVPKGFGQKQPTQRVPLLPI